MHKISKIDLIGGLGFIGSRLANRLYLSKNYHISIIDKVTPHNLSTSCKLADVRNIDQLMDSLSHGSIVINLAAEHFDNVLPESLYYDVNVIGAKNICDAASSKGINKIIFTSSVAVYGLQNNGVDERCELKPYNAYGRSKALAEQIFIQWQLHDPTVRSLTIIRPTVVFGEGNRGNFYNLIKAIASKKFIMIGSGKNIKSIAYVENIAAYIEYSISHGPGIHIRNYIDNPNYTIKELVYTIASHLNLKPKNNFHVPIFVGLLIGYFFDFLSYTFNKKFPISAIRIKKFTSNTYFKSINLEANFKQPHNINDSIRRTVLNEINKK